MSDEASAGAVRPRGSGREDEATVGSDATAARTHVGHVRSRNEDGFVCGARVLAVADGVGGHPGGDVASAVALQPLAALQHALARDGLPADPHAALTAAVRRGNADVLAAAAREPGLEGMATTLTAALLGDDAAYLAHVGDSRAYLWRPGQGLRQLTTDHSVVGEAVAAGLMSPEAADAHPDRHVITRVVGLEPDVEVDAPEPVPLRDGDRIVLCSDGLPEGVARDEVARILGSTPTARTAAEALVDAALAGGAPDNVTVAVAVR